MIRLFNGCALNTCHHRAWQKSNFQGYIKTFSWIISYSKFKYSYMNWINKFSCTTKTITFQINLSHCYLVTDAGIQWIVGSCHSPSLHSLDLSNTDLTGNSFLRRLPQLSTLVLDCCASLSGKPLFLFLRVGEMNWFKLFRIKFGTFKTL